MTNEGFTIQNAHQNLELFQAEIEKLVPNPITHRLLALDHEYTMIELRDLLQHFSSYLASLCGIQGRVEAEFVLIKKGLKTGLDVASLNNELVSSTVTGKEAELIASNESFAELKKLEIYNEANLALVNGWVKAYENAYRGVSRIFSVDSVEATLPRYQ